jgi:hypothetical protein
MYRKDVEPLQALVIYRVSPVSRWSSAFRSLRRPVSLLRTLLRLPECFSTKTDNITPRKTDGS